MAGLSVGVIGVGGVGMATASALVMRGLAGRVGDRAVVRPDARGRRVLVLDLDARHDRDKNLIVSAWQLGKESSASVRFAPDLVDAVARTEGTLAILAGFALRRFRVIGEQQWAGLDQICYFVLFPAIIFKEIAAAYDKIKDEPSRCRYELLDTEAPGDSPLDAFVRHARLATRPAPLGFDAMKEFLRASAKP